MGVISRMEEEEEVTVEEEDTVEVQTAISLSLQTGWDQEEDEMKLAMAVSIASAAEEEERKTEIVSSDDDELEKLSFAVAMSLATELDDTRDIPEPEATFECECCSDDSCLLVELCMCEESCMFCRECVRRGAEVAIGEGKTVIDCFAGCGSVIGDEILRTVLPIQVFELLQQHRQMEEVDAAGLEDLEHCPACSFAIILTETLFTVLICGNPNCGKETCRLCKEVKEGSILIHLLSTVCCRIATYH